MIHSFLYRTYNVTVIAAFSVLNVSREEEGIRIFNNIVFRSYNKNIILVE